MAVTQIATQFAHGGRLEIYDIDVDFGSIATVATGTVDVTLTGLATTDRVISVVYNAVGNDDVPVIPIVVITANTLTFKAYNPTAGSLDPASVRAQVTILRR